MISQTLVAWQLNSTCAKRLGLCICFTRGLINKSAECDLEEGKKQKKERRNCCKTQITQYENLISKGVVYLFQQTRRRLSSVTNLKCYRFVNYQKLHIILQSLFLRLCCIGHRLQSKTGVHAIFGILLYVQHNSAIAVCWFLGKK